MLLSFLTTQESLQTHLQRGHECSTAELVTIEKQSLQSSQ